MTLEDVLKTRGMSVRLTCEDKWLVHDDDNAWWVVYQRKPYQRRTSVLIATEDLTEALKKFTEDWEATR